MTRPVTPILIVMCGLPGSGKTTVGGFIAQSLDALVLRTDVIRKKLFTKPTYSFQESKKVYADMFQMAEAALAKKKNVVLDATFSLRIGRDRAHRIARAHKARFFLLRIICNESKIHERLHVRSADEESDARWPQYLGLKKTFEKPRKEEHPFIIDTSDDWSGSVDKLIALLAHPNA